MEEVDQIIVHTLRQIGCEFEEIRSLREFNTELVIEGVVRCLKLINPSLELSHHVPPSMSARYRLGSTLASACTDLGYKGEIGYQTFLYSNEGDVRKIFLFLMEKLPKESEKVFVEPLGKCASIVREVSVYCAESMNKPWLRHYCRDLTGHAQKFFLSDLLSSCNPFKTFPVFIPNFKKSSVPKQKELQERYNDNFLLPLHEQISQRSILISSLLENNTLNFVKQGIWNEDHINSSISKETKLQKAEKMKQLLAEYIKQSNQQKKSSDETGLDGLLRQAFKGKEKTVKASRFTHVVELQFTADKDTLEPPGVPVPAQNADTEEVKRKKWEEEVTQLQIKIDSLTSKLSQLDLQNKKYASSLQQILELISKEEEKISDIKESNRVKKCTLSLLPDAENNVESLQAVIDGSSQRLISLATQWEQHRAPLIEQYRDMKDMCSQRLNETQRKLEEIKDLREKIKETGVEARHKEETYKQLISAYERLTKDVNRSAYTRRILEIVSNIKKQKAEIDKVLLDTRNIQKEINRLSGKLDRTFTVTDELIFRDAKKDEAVRRAYKYLAALHDTCSQIVHVVEDTGTTVREIRELEDQIEQEKQKKVSATLERITSDYLQMQKENESLLAQLK